MRYFFQLRSRFLRQLLLGCYLSLMSFAASAAPTEIIFWHSFADNLERELEILTEGFNHSEKEYVVKMVYKGEYTESLINFAAAFRAKQAPALIQIFEVGSIAVLYPSGVIKPLYEILDSQHISLPAEDFFPAVRAFYSQKTNIQKINTAQKKSLERLVAMPLNVSLPIVYYNVDALAKVGYPPEKFPTSWQALERLLSKLKSVGFQCGYTTAYPAWIHIESFSALHGIPLFDPITGKAMYGNSAVLTHLERLKRWQNAHYFEYGGRDSNATVLFTSGRCPIFSQSSGAYNSLQEVVTFKLGVAPLPIDNTATKKRHNNLIGGAALWAVSGQSEEVYRGIVLFFSYLSQAQAQKRWYQNTGYLPLGLSGVYASLGKTSHPILDLAKLELTEKTMENHFKLVGPQNLIRLKNDEALESLFAGIKTPQEALQGAVIHSNYLLKRFNQNTSSHAP